jgi:hypothetical protein
MKRKRLPINVAAISAVMAAAILWLAVLNLQVSADDAAPSSATADQDTESASLTTTDADNGEVTASIKPAPVFKLSEPKGAKRLSPDYDAWIDPKNKTVIVDGQVSLREGMLEMFACTRNTKEHESIVSVNSKAFLVHAALLSLGAEPGRPVQFVPKYRPPTGTEIEITVLWRDEAGKEKTARAQDWIKDINTKKAMAHPFVFAGSSFWIDEETKKKFYQAEGGDFICVSNFGTAMLDIPIESSQANTELAFEAFTERIPPLGAPVRLILKPKLKKAGSASKESGTSGEEREKGATTTENKETDTSKDADAPTSEKDGKK